MRPLQLDFIGGRTLPPSWGLSLLVAGCIALVAVVFETRDLSARIEQAQASLRLMSGASPRGIGEATIAAVSVDEVRQANEILQQLTLPWSELFSAVETTRHEAVAILALQPDVTRLLLRIDGEAKDMEALLAYVARLEGNGALRQVRLHSHEMRLDDPQRPVRFSLDASWVVQP